jgi:hypothetical protein
MNKPLDINRVNTVLSWGSIFVLSWLLLLRRLPVDGISMFFFCFFILVAVGSWMGTVVEERQNNPKGESK